MYRTALSARARHTSTLLAFAGAVALAAACGDQLESPARDAAPGLTQPSPASMSGVAVARGMVTEGDAAKVAAPNGQLPGGGRVDSVSPSMVIRNGSVSIEVDSIELAVAAVRQMATRLGGYVGNVSMSAGAYEVRSATLELKIPSPRFEEAMNTLSPIGKVESSNSTAEDVGEEYVDVNARMNNAKRLEDRLVTLLATRAGKLEDVLAVERELARVREEIERYEGRLRFLKTRAAMSTLSVTVHERAPLVSPNPGTSVIGEAFKSMWRNFVHFVAAIIASLGVVIPVAGVLALIAWAWRRKGRSKGTP